MSPEIYLHEHHDFFDLIRVVAGERRIDPYLVEKDYWLVHSLYGLQKAGYDFQLKDGTSLSKGYGIIHRFSENIDIHIVPPESVQVRTSKNHDKEKDRQSRKDFYDYLSASIRIPGIVKVERDTLFDSLPKYFSGGIRLYYDAKFPSDGSAKEGVRLEVVFDDIIPNQPMDISSWMVDFALEKHVDVIDNRALQIRCYHPGYTFVEKLQAIVTKYRRHQDSSDEFPLNFMRHYYDVFVCCRMNRCRHLSVPLSTTSIKSVVFRQLTFCIHSVKMMHFLWLTKPGGCCTKKSMNVEQRFIIRGNRPLTR